MHTLLATVAFSAAELLLCCSVLGGDKKSSARSEGDTLCAAQGNQADGFRCFNHCSKCIQVYSDFPSLCQIWIAVINL